MNAQHSEGAPAAATGYTKVPLPWFREDGSVCHCYPLTVPPQQGREGERRVFVYCEPGRLPSDVIDSWLARIYELWSNPSWDPPWGAVIDLDATAEADLIAGVVKGSAFVVLDSRMKDDPRRYALVKLTGGRFLGQLHPAKRRMLAPALQARAQRRDRSTPEEERELRQHNAALALAATSASPAKQAYANLRRAFFRLFAKDLAEDLPKRREQHVEGDEGWSDLAWTDARAGTFTPRWAERVELAATLEAAMRHSGLAPRERQACEAVRAGKTLAEWAEEEGISDATARGYWHEAQRKLRPHLDLP